jgi:hypothetical protein
MKGRRMFRSNQGIKAADISTSINAGIYQRFIANSFAGFKYNLQCRYPVDNEGY